MTGHDNRGDIKILPAGQALARLRKGNARYVAGTGSIGAQVSDRSREASAARQAPFAVILGCSDSRVPVEVIFDQGLGELFVIRVAGNIVAPSQIGSVEFAAQNFGTRLVVVLGHTSCGAVEATVDDMTTDTGRQSRNVYSIVDRIRPSVSSVLAERPAATRSELIDGAVRANVRVAVADLCNESEVLKELMRDDDLTIVGAEYSLIDGTVDFFDGPADSR